MARVNSAVRPRLISAVRRWTSASARAVGSVVVRITRSSRTHASADRLASCSARACVQGVNLVIDPVEPAHPQPPVVRASSAPVVGVARRRFMIMA